MKTVKEVSRITGVSVRTLHHYDAIGLLRPTQVTESGYRLYDDAALQRLQTILFFRELEFPLQEIKDILDNVPGLMGVFDAANLIMNDQDPMAGFEATAEKLQYVHMKDAIAKYKTTIAVGCGEGRYDEVLQKVDAMTDRTVTLTLEPHLFGFKAFKEIDSHELKTAVTYGSADEAFDAAATALKTVLTNIGFHEEGNVWTK